ncbi:MAG: SusE domain-containing protein [Flavobacterium sp.]|jgi:hypothetical protein|uniref:SusE domain-containing protein n=1 Tax=Flavobacterium sp. TaxID=239 RepID=UPI003BA7D90D
MKNTVKFLFAFLAFAGLSSCEDEDNFRYLEPNGAFQILTPDAGTAITLDPNLQNNPSITLTWRAADFGSPTEVEYNVEFAKTGTEFESPVIAATTTGTNVTWNVLEFNNAVVGAGLTPFSEGGLEIRVKATVGTTSSLPVYSNTITILVTPFSTDLPQLAVPGNHQGWNPPTAPRLASSAFGETDYEGYVWLDGGYKFVGPDASGAYNWGNTDWGDDGSFSGILAETGESDCTNSAGYYRVRANTTTLEYTTDATVWGIVGFATTGNDSGWNQSIPLTYNQESKKWEGIVTLSAGEFKFRANNAWTINLGGDPASMSYDGSNLSVNAAGSYLVKLDLSTPRQYTYELVAQ